MNFGQKDLKISKDNPPDLKPLVDAVEKYTFATGGADAKAPATAQAGNSSGGKSGKKDKKAGDLLETSVENLRRMRDEVESFMKQLYQ